MQRGDKSSPVDYPRKRQSQTFLSRMLALQFRVAVRTCTHTRRRFERPKGDTMSNSNAVLPATKPAKALAIAARSIGLFFSYLRGGQVMDS